MPAHFAAKIRILPEDEGGRRMPPFNRIRWDFGYATDAPAQEIYMIWPEFLDVAGQPIADKIPLVGDYAAKMRIVSPKAVAYHSTRISIGTQFHCHEGARIVATGIVTKILALK